MPVCLRCGEKFKNNVDVTLPICPKCREYENTRGFISCRVCNALLEPDEAINGFCPECRSFLEDDYDESLELVSLEDLEDDDLEDDFDN